MKKMLTEELPSSGTSNHEHNWQKLEGGSDNPDEMVLVCRHEGCGATKTVRKPKLQEDKGGKQLLLG